MKKGILKNHISLLGYFCLVRINERKLSALTDRTDRIQSGLGLEAESVNSDAVDVFIVLRLSISDSYI